MSQVNNLKDTQERLQQALVDPVNAPFPHDLIKSSSRLSAQAHFAIYQRSYVARLRQCMAKQFSALEYALGKELFSQFADGYLSVYPSTNYNLINLGELFPNYLEQTRPDKNDDEKEDWPDFMIELAKFEYAINVIFEEKLEKEYVLATDETQDASLELIPILYLYEFQFPIQWYYSSFANDLNPDLPLPQQSWSVISRHNYKLAIHNVNQGQFYFLKYFKECRDFHETVHAFVVNFGVDREAFKELWPTWKREWLKIGLLADTSQ